MGGFGGQGHELCRCWVFSEHLVLCSDGKHQARLKGFTVAEHLR